MRYQHEAHSSYLLMSRTLAQSLPGQHKLNILFSDCDHAGTQALWIVPCDENPIQGRLFGELNVTPQQIAKIHEIMDFYGVDGGVAQNTMATDMAPLPVLRCVADTIYHCVRTR